tara:strand:+ start:265 stop:1002 length:738 start_codon:yes stop_codon:yes gene_type:complete
MILFNQKEVITKQSILDFCDAKITEIDKLGNHLCIIFKEENIDKQELETWRLVMTLDQFTQVRREIDIPSISPIQLKAIHAKEAAKKKEALVAPEPIEEVKEPNVNFSEENIKTIQTLKREEASYINWKSNEEVKEATLARRRIDPDIITRLLNYVFRFHQRMVKTDGYSHSHRDKDRNLAYFLKTIAPKSVGLPTLSCQKIYTGQSYQDITKVYRQNWVNLCMYFIKRGDKDKLPGYLVKHYVG